MKIDLSFMQSGTPRQQAAWQSLRETRALERLADFDAVLAGTIPIDVDIPGSDLDIICEARDLVQCEQVVARHFSEMDSFKIQRFDVDGEASMLASFKHGQFCYEIFAQAVPVLQQNAVLHMLVEVQLLSIGGERARQAVRRLKLKGIKTEPAFAAYFGIRGDPYVELRKMALRWIEEPNFQAHGWPSRSFQLTHSGSILSPGVLGAASQELISAMGDFCRTMLDELRELGLVGQAIEMDHACYRVSTGEKYEALKLELESCAILLSEAFVNGRPIASYQLHTPIKVDDEFTVEVLELPAPKPGRNYSDGFEHVEVVLKVPLEIFMAQHPDLRFDTGNQHAAINRDVAVKLKGGVVKFHETSLEQVIAQEQAALLQRDAPAPVVIVDFEDTLVSSRAEPTEINCDIDQIKRGLGFKVQDRRVPVGVSSMLSCFQSEGLRVLVCTARDHDTTHDDLRSTGLLKFIDGIFVYEDPKEGKQEPTTEMLMTIRGAQGVLIGDSITDAMAADRLGFPFLQARWVQRNDLPVTGHSICATPFAAIATTFEFLRSVPHG